MYKFFDDHHQNVLDRLKLIMKSDRKRTSQVIIYYITFKTHLIKKKKVF